MARVDVKGPIQLNLPESSTVIVLSTGKKDLSLEGISPRDPFKLAIIGNDVVLAAIQDYLRFGPDDADNEGKVSRLVNAAMGSGASFEEIFTDVGQTALETRLEGPKIGKPALRLAAAHNHLMEAIEEAFTTPAASRKKVS